MFYITFCEENKAVLKKNDDKLPEIVCISTWCMRTTYR